MSKNSKLNTIPEAVKDLSAGKVIIVVDDEDRENEGDFVVAADYATPEVVNFMATEGRGLICAPLLQNRCKELGLSLMTDQNSSQFETPFTVSVDLNSTEISTGISAADRSATIKALADVSFQANDFARPGHIFPLVAKAGGVLRRTGHTEASVDLATLAGCSPAAAIVEIMNADGSMARLPDLLKIAKKFGLKIVSIKDLVSYRLRDEKLVSREAVVNLPTKFGDFQLIAYSEAFTSNEHFALIKGNWTVEDSVLVRMHSSCLTGDLLASLRCDCGPQLESALIMIEKAGTGALVYLNQEGRGIGLTNKLKAYELQEKGLDTVEANLALGFKQDQRDYGVGAQILRDLNILKLKLISNNPRKQIALDGYGLEIVENVPIEIACNPHNQKYLATKKNKLGHNLQLLDQENVK